VAAAHLSPGRRHLPSHARSDGPCRASVTQPRRAVCVCVAAHSPRVVRQAGLELRQMPFDLGELEAHPFELLQPHRAGGGLLPDEGSDAAVIQVFEPQAQCRHIGCVGAVRGVHEQSIGARGQGFSTSETTRPPSRAAASFERGVVVTTPVRSTRTRCRTDPCPTSESPSTTWIRWDPRRRSSGSSPSPIRGCCIHR